MRFDSLAALVGGLPCFDLPLLTQADSGKRPALRVQLSRWMKEGKILGLRRGVYLLAPAYRRQPLNVAVLANRLYYPSYLSGLWALGYYDMIPEQVAWLTSVTPRVPRQFKNAVGVFDYRNIKQTFFFGYGVRRFGQQDVLIADPEKALLDHWHLTAGEWTAPRLAEMRYQGVQHVCAERLKEYAARFGRPRLARAAERWLALKAEDTEGWVTL